MLFTEQPVAVVFDWDKTLSPHYMQRPIFEEYGVDEKEFWKSNRARATANTAISGLQCFVEHGYLNMILDKARDRTFKGLDNAKLSELGQKIELYPGVEDLFRRLKATGAEIYIASAGIRTMIKDIPFVIDTVTEVYGSEFADYKLDDSGVRIPYVPTKDKPNAIQSVIRVVLPTDKIRILQEISKGCLQGNFDGSVGIRQEERRIPFKRMIYVGDGVSDIFAFDTVRNGGGYAVGVYNPDEPAFEQMEMIRRDGWLDMVGITDFTKDSTVGNWILQKVQHLQAEVRVEQAAARDRKLNDVRAHVPVFVNAWGKN